MALLDEMMMNPQSMGLLGLGSGLLQASGPSRMPITLGQAIGGALPMGVQGAQQAYAMRQQDEMNKLRREMMALEMEQAKRAEEARRRQEQGLAEFEDAITPKERDVTLPPLTPNDDEGNVNPQIRGRAVGVDQQAAQRALLRTFPKEYAAQMFGNMFKERTPISLKEGEMLLDPKTFQPIAGGPKAPSLTGEDANIAMMKFGTADPAKLAQIPGAADAILAERNRRAASGATRVDVKTGQKFGEVFASDAAKGFGESKGQANAAANTLQTINKMNEAINSGNVITGVGSKYRQFGLQLGNTLGVTGKNADERLANTRNLVQGAAQISLEGAKIMQGQGQVSNYEREMVQRASVGDIDNMTEVEFKALLSGLEKVNRARIQAHNKSLENVPPEFAPYIPMYRVNEPPVINPPSTAAPQGTSVVDDLLKKYGNQNGGR